MPIGVEKTATGYEVAWKITGADQYTVWNADSNGNFVSILVGVLSGSSLRLEALETSFHQDLNGDGVIGLPHRRDRSGWVDQPGPGRYNYFYLCADGDRIWPGAEYGGTSIVAGQSVGRRSARRQTAGGYEVAWKLTGADQYTVWITDSSGNYVSDTDTAICPETAVR